MYNQDQLKELVANKAVAEFVKSGMVVGLGTGSTANYVVYEIGRKLKSGELVDIVGVPTSNVTRDLAIEYGIPLLSDLPVSLDLTIDGADRVNLQTGDCIKGWGGAHYIEKRIAKLGSQLVIIIDKSKVCESFVGERIPLEVSKNAVDELTEVLKETGTEFLIRDQISDSGNIIIDVIYSENDALKAYHDYLCSLPGVLDTGIFSGLISQVLVSEDDGSVQVHSFQKGK